ncbi:MAG: SurA N-terminal domain-containing protein [Clostridia bacterium]
MFRNKILLMSCLLPILLVGCNSDITQVNNIPLSKKQINTQLEAQLSLTGLSCEKDSAVIESVKQNIIDDLIDQEFLIREAQKQDIKVSEEEISSKFYELMNIWDDNEENQKALRAQGYTTENMKEMVEQQLIIDKLMDSLVTISDRQLEDYYKSHLFLFSKYTIKSNQGSSEVLFPQLPFQVQQTIREGKDVVGKPHILDGSQSKIIITEIATLNFDQVQSDVKNQLTEELKLQKAQELILRLRGEAQISTN